MNNKDGSVVKTILGKESFVPGDIVEVKETYDSSSYKKASVSIWSTAKCLVVRDDNGNEWCLFDANMVRKVAS